jgi:hypothetical protein
VSSIERGWIRRALRVSDLVVLAAVICTGVASSVFIFVRRDRGVRACTAVVQVDGEVVRTILLERSRPDSLFQLHLARGKSTLEVSSARIRVRPMPDSVCPLHICSRAGWIERPGEFIACVPNKLIITIRGERDNLSDTLDAIIP